MMLLPSGKAAVVKVPGIILLLAGLLILWLAVLSWQERLPRNGLVGVRTPATMRSDEAFRIANKTAAPFTAAGGLVWAAGGLASLFASRHFVGFSVFGGVVLGAALMIAGGVRGVRACR
jgi:uncharacterized membrane protein